MTRPIAGYIVSMGSDGRVSSHGSVSEALAADAVLAKELTEEQQILDKVADEVDPSSLAEESKTDGKLIVAEEIEEGHVSWAARAQ